MTQTIFMKHLTFRCVDTEIWSARYTREFTNLARSLQTAQQLPLGGADGLMHRRAPAATTSSTVSPMNAGPSRTTINSGIRSVSHKETYERVGDGGSRLLLVETVRWRRIDLEADVGPIWGNFEVDAT